MAKSQTWYYSSKDSLDNQKLATPILHFPLISVKLLCLLPPRVCNNQLGRFAWVPNTRLTTKTALSEQDLRLSVATGLRCVDPTLPELPLKWGFAKLCHWICLLLLIVQNLYIRSPQIYISCILLLKWKGGRAKKKKKKKKQTNKQTDKQKRGLFFGCQEKLFAG